ncbi:hypothetical protein [Agrococcus jejuensis]|uniref:hypothetical protein n=1 Tax=Agrococcus jejuensis TaxID=399736 RepID=UPI0011A8D442|nr:hypothetical protein [Agrococcus jejuensis]
MKGGQHEPREVVIPSVPFGPIGVPHARADANYYRLAARNIRSAAARGGGFAGSNLTETVARLCEAAAEALYPKSGGIGEGSDA